MTRLLHTCTIGNNTYQLAASNQMTLLLLMVSLRDCIGPLLFLLYINDFRNCCRAFDFHIFADDTNYNLTLVSNWLKANKLSLNIDKTNFIIFHPPQKAIKHRVMLSINNKAIKQEKHIKYLGLFIDSHLCWKYYILHITKR